MPETPLSHRLVESGCLAYGLWTLCCHLTVWAGGSLVHLVWGFGLLLGVAVALALRARRTKESREAPSSPGADGGDDGSADEPRSPRDTRPHLRLCCAVGAVVGTPLLHWFGTPLLLWWWILGLLCVGFFSFVAGSGGRLEQASTSRLGEAVLWCVGLVCALLALIAHRSDYDDSLYVNLAVSAADHPWQPLLAGDTLHGIPGLPLPLAIYSAQSWEVAIGAFSWLTGVAALPAFHLFAAALGAVAVPLCYARLFRTLLPAQWLPATIAAVVVLWATGEVHRGYGNFGFVRIWQGKGLLVSLALPLVASFALEYASRPRRRTLLLLTASQIAAVGFNVTAFWAAPAVSLSCLVSGLRAGRDRWRTFAMGAATSSYLIVFALVLRGDVSRVITPDGAVFDYGALGEMLATALGEVVGVERLRVVALIALPLAWTITPVGMAQRFAIGLPLAAWIVLLNPYLAWLVHDLVTGPAYWRSLWVVPLPVLLVLVILTPLHLGGRDRKMLAASAALLAAYAIFVPTSSTLASENRTLLRWPPTLKVRWPMYEQARRIDELVPDGAFVLAPDLVGLWLPTFHHHPHPLKARHYLDLNRFHRGEDDFERRSALIDIAWLGAPDAASVELLRTGLEEFSIDAVCFRRQAGELEIEAVLRSSGFVVVDQDDRFEIWYRDPSLLFYDGFDSGDTSSWRSHTGR
ncbi:MAG: hypothetical protein DWQ36_08055 [Acidobacteria bacterium]|nr:MAG: hypothetical protein DWQ30_03770 [Acidobacteriota bacterium]REK08914.1 MAG: hypothetical protein DWQ36_08055 [Acidobacteriota bacterium]